MAWGFKKRIKIAPGLHVNIGKRGVSARVGGRVAGVTVGSDGTKVSANLPGTGLSVRKKISGGRSRTPPAAVAAPELLPQGTGQKSRKSQYWFAIIAGIAAAIIFINLT